MDKRISGARGRLFQERQARPAGWTKAKRKSFLDALAESCNVMASAKAAGVSSGSAYRLRQGDPAFAALWAEALAIGYHRLEDALLGYAVAGVNAIEIDVPDAPPPLDPPDDAEAAKGTPVFGTQAISNQQVQLALHLLNRHRASVDGSGPPAGRRRRVTAAETDAALRMKLDMLARKLKDGS